jgi:hypothetical protein
VLEITGRTLVQRQGQLSTSTTSIKHGKRTSSTTTRTKEHDVVLAAKNLVGSLENWVKKNYTRLQVK